MEAAAIFALIEKGLVIISTLIEAGRNAGPAIQVLKDLITGAKTGTVSDEDLAKMEALLDQMLAEFNTDEE